MWLGLQGLLVHVDCGQHSVGLGHLGDTLNRTTVPNCSVTFAAIVRLVAKVFRVLVHGFDSFVESRNFLQV